MVTYISDAFSKANVKQHLCYNEQGAAIASCSWSNTALKHNDRKISLAYATSGPGVTNMITGIANAYYDSIPVIYILGHVNRNEQKGDLPVRQLGFQEMPAINIIADISKYAVTITNENDFEKELIKAFKIATTGRKGPVCIEIPIDVLRSEICEFNVNNILKKMNQPMLVENKLTTPPPTKLTLGAASYQIIEQNLQSCKRPIILLGNGIFGSNTVELKKFIQKYSIPVVTSLHTIDAFYEYEYNFGFIGTYGKRSSNYILDNADLIVSIGSRMDFRQTGSDLLNFAKNAKLIRIDIDNFEFSKKVKSDEIQILDDFENIEFSNISLNDEKIKNLKKYAENCKLIEVETKSFDNSKLTELIDYISTIIPRNAVVTSDVGQNQMLIAQNFSFKGQIHLTSGGFGAMGYSLPASIGAALYLEQKSYKTIEQKQHSSKKTPTFAFMGDGGVQMNIQELQTIIREQLNICIVLLNNNALGMIKNFQTQYFNSNFIGTTIEGGYTNPDFIKIFEAYEFETMKINVDDYNNENLKDFIKLSIPRLIEITFNDNDVYIPKLAFGNPLSNQDPQLPNNLTEKLRKIFNN